MKANLLQPGQTAYVPRTRPNSWADGTRVLIGQDVIDFNLKVVSVDPQKHTETLLIEHLPPPALHIQRPAPWMQLPASGTPNNFVQISKEDDDFIAETGKETFDVRLILDTTDGHILSAIMHNPVALTVRLCHDQALTRCEPATQKTILREINWTQIR